MNEQSKNFREYLQMKRNLNNSKEAEKMIDEIYNEVLEEKENTKKDEERY